MKLDLQFLSNAIGQMQLQMEDVYERKKMPLCYNLSIQNVAE